MNYRIDQKSYFIPMRKPIFYFRNKEIKITNFFLTQTVVVISSMCIIAAFFWINGKYKSMQSELDRVQVEYVHSQKELIKRETQHAINDINYSIKRADQTLRNKIKFRVYQAHRIASNIYNENVGKKTNAEIKKLIKDALRPVVYDNKYEYIFIASLNGTEVLFPTYPELEGKNVYDYQDELGHYIMQEEIKIVTTKGEGFSESHWRYAEEDTITVKKKLSYVKLFQPFNWYIGTGCFYYDHTKSMKDEILASLSNYRYGKEGYIFVNTYDGDALLMNGEIVTQKMNAWDLEDANGIKVIQEERKAVKKAEGDYIYYSWRRLSDSVIIPKMSFIKGIPEWEWMVGTGVYLDEINSHLNSIETELKNKIIRDIKFVVILSLGIFIFLSLIAIFTSRKLKKNISLFIRFFETATKNYKLIDKSKIAYSEFNTIADYANKMITNLKVTETKKKEEQAHYKKLFDESIEAIAFVDKEEKVQRINQAFTKLFGYTIGDLRNKNLNDVIVPKKFIKEALNYSKNFKEGTYDEVEAIRYNKERKKIHVAITGAPVLVNNQNLGTYIVYRNITNQKIFEQELYTAKVKAEESDRLKSSFLTNLSHEIRTPLNAIIGFSTLLNTKDIGAEEQKEYLKILENSGKSLLEIIDNIIDFSKIESSTLVINKTNNNFNELLDEILIDYVDFKNNMSFDKIDLKLKKEGEQNNLFVFTDFKRIKQVFTNLLDNAFKFTEKGEISFGYKIESDDIVCFVKDTGIGINKEELKFIFDRFRQVDESSTRKYGGTGIGLALCKSLIELLDGRIWVESNKNEGSTFYFTIPLADHENVKKKNPEQKTLQDFNWSHKKILIAEDVETNYKLLETILSRSNAKILWAKDGNEVVEMVEINTDIDLILMDINMPIMNGHEATKILKSKGLEIPIIAQTAYATEEQKNEILSMGYDDYVLKPITFQVLFQKVSKFLD